MTTSSPSRTSRSPASAAPRTAGARSTRLPHHTRRMSPQPWDSRAWSPPAPGPGPPARPHFRCCPLPSGHSGPGAPHYPLEPLAPAPPRERASLSFSPRLSFLQTPLSGFLFNSSISFSLSVSPPLSLFSVSSPSHRHPRPLPVNAAMLFCLLYFFSLIVRKDILTVEM